MTVPDFAALETRFRQPNIVATALFGSHSRGDAGPYSDVDLQRFTTDENVSFDDDGSHLIDGRLVVVGTNTRKTVEHWFGDPFEAVQIMSGIRAAKVLHDPQGVFVAIQSRADAFQWTDALEARATDWINAQLVGWVEEVGKGLEGLRRRDLAGRLTQVRAVLPWGLTRIAQVHSRVFIESDNSLLDRVTEAMGGASDWSRLCRQAHGLEDLGLVREAVACLRLYEATCSMVHARLVPGSQPLIEHTLEVLRDATNGER